MAKVNPPQVQKFLRDVDYPVTKDELIRVAEDQRADERVLDTLRRLPMDNFNSPNDVAKGIGQVEDNS